MIVWNKDTNETQCKSSGKTSKHRKEFKKWIKELKSKYEKIKMKIYVDYMLEKEMQQERDGPTYIQSWQKPEIQK